MCAGPTLTEYHRGLSEPLAPASIEVGLREMYDWNWVLLASPAAYVALYWGSSSWLPWLGIRGMLQDKSRLSGQSELWWKRTLVERQSCHAVWQSACSCITCARTTGTEPKIRIQ